MSETGRDERGGEASLGAWEPAPLSEVVALFSASTSRWWITGGHAIEIAVGRRIRDHADIDVLVLRRDQQTVQEVLAGWQWFAADPPGSLREWLPAEVLPDAVHDIWCRPSQHSPWRIQIMLDESSGDEWVSRRDPRIRRTITSLGCATDDGVPYIAPEVQLFYKANQRRLKDELDLAAALPVLTTTQREWLDSAIRDCYSDAHPWRRHLA